MTFLRDLWAGIWARVVQEPVLTLGLVNALILLAVGFGLRLSSEQVALIGAATAALLSWIARSRVTPA